MRPSVPATRFEQMPHTSPRRILQTLNEVGWELLSDGPPENHLQQQILAAAMALLPLAACGLWRRDAAHAPHFVRLAAAIGDRGRPPFPRTFNLAGSISQRVLETRRCRTVPDLGAEPRSVERTLAAQRSLVSLVCAPAAGEGRDPAGLLMGFTDARYDFTALDILTAEALARQAGFLWHVAGLRRKARRLQEELQTRKRVDRAKEILMDRRGLSGEDAFRWIQKRSMDTRRSMRDVAETIILSEETGHYTSIPHALDFSPKSTPD